MLCVYYKKYERRLERRDREDRARQRGTKERERKKGGKSQRNSTQSLDMESEKNLLSYQR